MACNLQEDGGRAAVEDYINSFSNKEKEEMSTMLAFVKKYGAEKTKRMVTAGLEFSDDDYVGPEID